MKYLKLAIIMASSLVLFSCDNFQKKNAQQQLAIKMIRKELPIKYDEHTTLTDVDAIDDILVYKYDFEGLDEETLKSKAFQDDTRVETLVEYCKVDSELNAFKENFPNGLRFSYFLNNKEVSSVSIKPSECDK